MAAMLQRTKAAFETVTQSSAQLSQLLRGPTAAAINWQRPAEVTVAPPQVDGAVPAMVFLGPPGVGKGTYSTRVAQHFGVPHISAGDLARDEMRAGTARGRQVRSKCQLLTFNFVAADACCCRGGPLLRRGNVKGGNVKGARPMLVAVPLASIGSQAHLERASNLQGCSQLCNAGAGGFIGKASQ